MAQNYGPKIVTNGLVLSVDAADRNSYIGSGSLWRDLSTSAADVTLVNAPTFNSANGGSIVFDGVNEYGQAASTGFFNTATNTLFADNTNAFTISVWVRFPVSPTTARSTGNTAYVIIGKSGGIGGAETFSLFVGGNGNTTYGDFSYRIAVGIRGSKTAISPTAVNTNLWNHVSITWNGTSAIGYFNGSSIGGLNVGTAGIQTGYFYNIGATGNGSTSFVYEGGIAANMVYNRALSAAEIAQNYNAQRIRFT